MFQFRRPKVVAVVGEEVQEEGNPPTTTELEEEESPGAPSYRVVVKSGSARSSSSVGYGAEGGQGDEWGVLSAHSSGSCFARCYGAL